MVTNNQAVANLNPLNAPDTFFTFICCEIVLFVCLKRPKINKKRSLGRFTFIDHYTYCVSENKEKAKVIHSTIPLSVISNRGMFYYFRASQVSE